MLYITTRNDKDAFTAYKALTENVAVDGGKFVPFHLPVFSTEEVLSFKDKTFGDSIAQILNLFFSTHLNGLDVDFAVGRNVLRIVPMFHKVLIGELWHNLDGSYDSFFDSLYRIVADGDDTAKKRTEWFDIAVRIATLFAVYGQMLNSALIGDDDFFDACFSSDNLSAQMSAWYARSMGLPIRMIISTSEADGSAWELVHRGTLNPVTANKDLVSGAERLLHAACGCMTVQKYLCALSANQIFSISDESLHEINSGLFCSVPGNTRSHSVINSVYRSNAYIMDPDTALNFGGLQDYRAKTGESKLTVLFAEETPARYLTQICVATGANSEKLMEMINRS